MQEILIKHNPYKILTEVKKNGETVGETSDFYSYLDRPFQEWIHKIPGFISKEINSKEYKIIFHGTELDCSDLEIELKNNKNEKEHYELEHIKAKEYSNKIAEIDNLFGKIQKIPREELQSQELKKLFEETKNNLVEVNIFAQMSAGKSTLVNALLGKELLPSRNGACTAIISKIQDIDNENFSAEVKDKDGNVMKIYSELKLEDMKNINEDKEVSEVYIKGDIPFLKAEDMSLVLVDTPGPDNAHDKKHAKITEKSLEKDSKMLVLFIMDANNLGNDTQIKIFEKIAESMKSEGKQSRERFIFIVNKADFYSDPSKYDENFIKEGVINSVKKMLEKHEIKDPNIILVSADKALKIKNRSSLTEREELVDIALDFDERHMHLEKYVNLSKTAENTLNEELKNAKEKEDIYEEALVHTGIRTLEEFIQTYLIKYSRPAKIKNLVDTFKAKIELSKIIEEMKQKITEDEAKLEEYQEKIRKLQEDGKIEDINKEYKEKIEKIDIVSAAKKELNIETRKLTDKFNESINSSGWVEEIESSMEETIREKLAKLIEQTTKDFEKIINEVLEKNVKAYSKTIVLEYIKKIESIIEVMNLAELKGDFISFKDNSIKELKNVSKIEVTKSVGYEPGDFWNTITFGFFGKKERTYKYIKKEDLIQKVFTKVEAGLKTEEEGIVDSIKIKQEELKKHFKEQFEKVDKKLEEIFKNLEEALSSRESAKNAYEESTKIKEQLEDIEKELERILEI